MHFGSLRTSYSTSFACRDLVSHLIDRVIDIWQILLHVSQGATVTWRPSPEHPLLAAALCSAKETIFALLISPYSRYFALMRRSTISLQREAKEANFSAEPPPSQTYACRPNQSTIKPSLRLQVSELKIHRIGEALLLIIC
jgi:hypothetical protein